MCVYLCVVCGHPWRLKVGIRSPRSYSYRSIVSHMMWVLGVHGCSKDPVVFPSSQHCHQECELSSPAFTWELGIKPRSSRLHGQYRVREMALLTAFSVTFLWLFVPSLCSFLLPPWSCTPSNMHVLKKNPCSVSRFLTQCFCTWGWLRDSKTHVSPLDVRYGSEQLQDTRPRPRCLGSDSF